MSGADQNPRLPSGPFDMGWQGWLIVAIIIAVVALFAATRRDWTSMLSSALVLPVIMLAIVYALSRPWRDGPQAHNRARATRNDADVLTFLARTNPLMFLFVGALSRGADDDRYQELLRSGPYGLGRYGYLIAATVFLAPLVLALIFTAVTGQLPAHSGPHFP